MGFCVDRSTRFLRRLGYNVVRHPGEGLAPLDLIGWEDNRPLRLGTLSQLVISSAAELPAVETGLTGANINGKTTSKLPASIGLDVLGSVLGAMGGKPSATASYQAAQTIEFSYDGVTKDRTNPIALGSYLRAGAVDWNNPVIHRYLLGGGRLFVVLEVVKSDSFGITAHDSTKTAIAVDVPAIQQAVGADVAVSYEANSRSTARFKGDKSLVFGFKCAELAAVDDDETGELRLCFKPLREGQVYFSIGDVDEVPEVTILTESGLVDAVGDTRSE